MSQPDWAYKKAESYMRGYMNLKTEAELFDHLGAMLCAERRRSVRVCKKLKATVRKQERECNRCYREACDDCAAAIDGKKL